MATSESSGPLGVKALFFDVFGTTVDWRSTVTKALHEQNQRTMFLADECSMPSATREKAAGMELADWGRFAAEWRETYYAFTRAGAAAVDRGEGDKYKTVDEHHLDSLRELIEKWGLRGLWNSETVHTLSLVWHSLDPWPDTVNGIKALNNAGLMTCTLSNGNKELLTDMAKYADLDWTHVFSAADFQSYKPNPKVYLGAVAKVGLTPSQTAMVATHLADLDAARKLGLRTIYVVRPQEEQWSEEKVEAAREWVDIWVAPGEDGFLTVAKRLREDRNT